MFVKFIINLFHTCITVLRKPLLFCIFSIYCCIPLICNFPLFSIEFIPLIEVESLYFQVFSILRKPLMKYLQDFSILRRKPYFHVFPYLEFHLLSIFQVFSILRKPLSQITTVYSLEKNWRSHRTFSFWPFLVVFLDDFFPSQHC